MTQTPDHPSARLRMKVSGMHCAGCSTAVQRALEGRPGVTSASVSLQNELAVVEGQQLQTDDLIEAVDEKGYKAEVAEEEQSPAKTRSEIEQRQIKHERQWRHRALIGLGVWIPLEILHWTAAGMGWEGLWLGWLMFAGATLVFATAGVGFYRSAIRAALRRTTNMDTLIALGATAAYVFSLVIFVLMLAGYAVEQPLYFAESAALLGIISLGHWLEARSSAKAGSAVRELLELQPDEAEVIDGTGQTRQISSGDVEPGQRLLIRPGGKVAVDGNVVEGESEVDEAVVTGESVPVKKSVGSTVVAGSINTTGRLVIEATVDGRHTTVSRIARIVEEAQSSKADIQNLADRVAGIFVPAVLSIAVVTFLGWWLVGDVTTGLISAVTVLIISCPCALGLATPMAVMVGTGAASRRGILIKSASALEIAGRTRQVIFDKTGTLTTGRPSVTDIEITSSELSETELLKLVAAVENPSEHPIAKAIVEAARERGLSIPPVEDFAAIPGEGVRGVVHGRAIEVRRGEEATCRITIDSEEVATMNVVDQQRPDAAEAIRRLREMEVEVIMLSGDRKAVAEAIGKELGFEPNQINAEATPESKSQLLAQSPAGTVMVGDGINDAAALAQADLGIAMASGTNIAIESADVVIPGDSVLAVPETIHLARKTLRTIRQNLFFAFFYNTVAIPAAAFGLLGLYGPLIAAAAMGFSDITVIGNALRLKRHLRIKKLNDVNSP